MAQIDILAPFILSWEGGYVNNKNDHGGATNMGVTLKTWQSVGYDKDKDGDIDVQDLKLITKEDAILRVLKPHYWDKVMGDEIKSQAIANILADWAWASGAKVAVKNVQILVGTHADGVMGVKTLEAINRQAPAVLFTRIWTKRKDFIDRIVLKNNSQRVFLRGWMNRLNSIKYTSLVCNGRKTITWKL